MRCVILRDHEKAQSSPQKRANHREKITGDRGHPGSGKTGWIRTRKSRDEPGARGGDIGRVGRRLS